MLANGVCTINRLFVHLREISTFENLEDAWKSEKYMWNISNAQVLVMTFSNGNKFP